MSKFLRLVFLTLLASFVWSCSSFYDETNTAGPVTEECPVAGTWQGIIPGGIMTGRIVTFVFTEAGSAVATVSTIRVESEYTREGNLFQIVDRTGTPAIAACPAHQVGRYNIQFARSCQRVEIVGVEDECNHRRATLLHFRGERR